MWVLIFLFIVCVLLIVQSYLRYRRLNKNVKDIPAIPMRLLIQLLRPNKTPVQIFYLLESVFNAANELAKYWIGHKLVLILNNPDDIQTVLMSRDCVEKSYFYRLIAGVGVGLFASNAITWKSDRKKINTVFTLSILKSFVPIFNQHSKLLVTTLDDKVRQPSFELTDLVFNANLDIVCETTMRADKSSRSFYNEELLDNMAKIWSISGKRIATYLYHLDFFYKFSNLYKEEQKILKLLLRLTPTYLSARHTEKNDKNESSICSKTNNNNNEDEKDSNPPVTKPIILLEKLFTMEKEGHLNREAVHDHVNTFIVAGTDTSSQTLCNTMLMLAMHPDIQDRVYNEIINTIIDSEYIDYDALSKLNYMELVLKESMRLFPLAQLIGRQALTDIKLRNCTIPKGSEIIMPLFKLQRNLKYWGETAHKFNPDRFLPEFVQKRHPFVFLPFSAGPRNCIGAKYAMISMKIMLCHLLTNYKFETDLKMSELIFKFESIMKLDTKIMLRLERRQH